LIGYKDIKGDLHCHSDWDGGVSSIREIAQKAKDMGYKYVGIADHTKFLKIERGLDEKQLRKRNQEIDKINKDIKGIKVLKGCEANILKDGSIDIEEEALAELDFAIAGIHSNFKMSKEEMTKRIIKAMENPNIDIISHPTGRLIQKRDAYEINLESILRKARETKTVLEINSFPVRLDLKDDHIRQAKEAGVKMIISTDAHQKEQINFMEFGIAQARRGWAEKKDIINTKSLDKFLKSLK
jgi:DNA polymerase (family X)